MGQQSINDLKSSCNQPILEGENRLKSKITSIQNAIATKEISSAFKNLHQKAKFNHYLQGCCYFIIIISPNI